MRKALIAMMLYSVLFGIFAVLSLISFMHEVAVFSIGLPAQQIDAVVFILSLAGIVKSLWHIGRL